MFGFQGPEANVTDLNLVFDKELSGSLESISLTVGSFDTPFGEQTAVLTNNADAFRNPFTPNSLFYSVFGGTVGTLNTLGVMGILETSKMDLTLAVTNGTDESAANADGNYEFVVSLGTDFGVSGLRTAASFISTDDSDPSGSNGLGMSNLPNPGLGVSLGGISPVTDQAIRRFQASVGRAINDDLVVKGEVFFDDYRSLSIGRSTDVIGVLISLNGRF